MATNYIKIEPTMWILGESITSVVDDPDGYLIVTCGEGNDPFEVHNEGKDNVLKYIKDHEYAYANH